ncbi:hypothetical protein GCM10028807_32180 [Spirosoma daeguense]
MKKENANVATATTQVGHFRKTNAKPKKTIKAHNTSPTYILTNAQSPKKRLDAKPISNVVTVSKPYTSRPLVTNDFGIILLKSTIFT